VLGVTHDLNDLADGGIFAGSGDADGGRAVQRESAGETGSFT